MIGWAAAAGHIGLEGWLIFAILFLWQFPHFYAIAWIYREDYGRAGIRMLPVIEPDGVSTGRRIIWYAVVLVPISLAPSLAGMTGKFYFVAALLLSTAYLASGLRTATPLAIAFRASPGARLATTVASVSGSPSSAQRPSAEC